MTTTAIRFFDFIAALCGIIVLFPIFIILFIIGYLDTKSPLFFQKRVGLHKSEFTLVKFRTMHLGTPTKGTHEVNVFQITKYGQFLRRTKLDELPQLFNVLIGTMSLVGPRPCLINQNELINERNKRKVFGIKPGITGLAQTKNIDMSTPELLAKTDSEMIDNWSVLTYFHFILITIMGKGQGDAIRTNK